jgi:hypothetical protein
MMFCVSVPRVKIEGQVTCTMSRCFLVVYLHKILYIYIYIMSSPL